MRVEKTKHSLKSAELEYEELREEGSLGADMERLWRPVEQASRSNEDNKEERK